MLFHPLGCRTDTAAGKVLAKMAATICVKTRAAISAGACAAARHPKKLTDSVRRRETWCNGSGNRPSNRRCLLQHVVNERPKNTRAIRDIWPQECARSGTARATVGSANNWRCCIRSGTCTSCRHRMRGIGGWRRTSHHQSARGWQGVACARFTSSGCVAILAYPCLHH